MNSAVWQAWSAIQKFRSPMDRTGAINMKKRDILSILADIERGALSIEDAEAELAEALDDSDISRSQLEAIKPVPAEKSEEVHVPTRRERKLALNEKTRNPQPHMMAGLTPDDEGICPWPWPDSKWQWMWQNPGYPVYVSHSIDVKDESELHIVSYQGDLLVRGWDEPHLKINGAVFDARIGQDGNIIRIASSTGQLYLCIPKNITRVNATVDPGDVWLSNVSADVEVHCKSGDLGCEWIKGNVKVRVNGGDARLIEIEGSIDVSVIRGNSNIQNISSTDVSLKATDGDIWLTLNSVKSGRFRCESSKGDINLLTNGELACELIVETSDGAIISPVALPWQQLLERSEGRLRAILMGGGANVSLVAKDGKIYIQESRMNISSKSSPE